MSELDELTEGAGRVLEELTSAMGTSADLTDLSKQYKFLELMFERFPEGVKRYLEAEPEHFQKLGQVSGDALAVQVNQTAFRILGYSTIGGFLIQLEREKNSQGIASAVSIRRNR